MGGGWDNLQLPHWLPWPMWLAASQRVLTGDGIYKKGMSVGEGGLTENKLDLLEVRVGRQQQVTSYSAWGETGVGCGFGEEEGGVKSYT